MGGAGDLGFFPHVFHPLYSASAAWMFACVSTPERDLDMCLVILFAMTTLKFLFLRNRCMTGACKQMRDSDAVLAPGSRIPLSIIQVSLAFLVCGLLTDSR